MLQNDAAFRIADLQAQKQINDALAQIAASLERGAAVSATALLPKAPWDQSGNLSGGMSEWRRFLRACRPSGKSFGPAEFESFVQSAMENRPFLDALANFLLLRGEDDREMPPGAQRLRVAALAPHSGHPEFEASFLMAGRGVARLQGDKANLAQEFAKACPPALLRDESAQRFLLNAWAFSVFIMREGDLRPGRRAFLGCWENAGLVNPSDYLGVLQECMKSGRHTSMSAQAGVLLLERLSPKAATPGQWRAFAKKAQRLADDMNRRIPLKESQALADGLTAMAEAAALEQIVERARKKMAPKTKKAASAGAKSSSGEPFGSETSSPGADAQRGEAARPRKPRML